MIVWISFAIVIISYFIIEEVYKKCWNHNLEIDVFLPEEQLYEGDITNIKEVIINDKMLPLPILEVFFHFKKGLKYTDMANSLVSDKLYRRDVFAVGMKRKISRTFEVACVKRGYYTLESLELMSSDLFMQQKFLGEKQFFKEFYVFPKKVKSEKIGLPYKKIMGDLISRKHLYEDPFSFGGVRDYAITDPMNRINWKASAKAQDLIVNMYESSINQKIVVVLDTFENRNSGSEDLNEESIRIAAALVERLFFQGVEVTLIGNGSDLITKELLCMKHLKGAGVPMIKQRLARLELGEENRIESFFDQVEKDTYVVLISKNLELQTNLEIYFKEFIWIIPYKYQIPEIYGMKGRWIPWQLEIAS